MLFRNKHEQVQEMFLNDWCQVSELTVIINVLIIIAIIIIKSVTFSLLDAEWSF